MLTIDMPQQVATGSIQPNGTSATVPSMLMRRLLAIKPGLHRIVSCFVRLTPEDRQRQQYLTDVKRRIVAVWEPAAERDLRRITEYLADTRNLPSARGLAVFACEAAELFEAVALPLVHRTRVTVDDTPWVRELVAADQNFGTLLAAVVDRAHARFFRVTAFGATELPGLHQPSRRGGKFHSDRQDSPGWGEAAYHGRIREERHRHLEAVAHRLDALIRTEAARGILLGGPHKETTALAKFLRPQLGRLVIGVVRLNPTAVTPAQVQEAAFSAAAEDLATETSALLARFQEALGTRWAVNGPHETLQALARGKVRTLVVCEGVELEGFRCSVSGRLVLSREECRGIGWPRVVMDVIDEAVEDALTQGIHVIVLENSAGKGVDRLGGFLRFR